MLDTAASNRPRCAFVAEYCALSGFTTMKLLGRAVSAVVSRGAVVVGLAVVAGGLVVEVVVGAVRGVFVMTVAGMVGGTVGIVAMVGIVAV